MAAQALPYLPYPDLGFELAEHGRASPDGSTAAVGSGMLPPPAGAGAGAAAADVFAGPWGDHNT